MLRLGIGDARNATLDEPLLCIGIPLSNHEVEIRMLSWKRRCAYNVQSRGHRIFLSALLHLLFS